MTTEPSQPAPEQKPKQTWSYPIKEDNGCHLTEDQLQVMTEPMTEEKAKDAIKKINAAMQAQFQALKPCVWYKESSSSPGKFRVYLAGSAVLMDYLIKNKAINQKILTDYQKTVISGFKIPDYRTFHSTLGIIFKKPSDLEISSMTLMPKDFILSDKIFNNEQEAKSDLEKLRNFYQKTGVAVYLTGKPIRLAISGGEKFLNEVSTVTSVLKMKTDDKILPKEKKSDETSKRPACTMRTSTAEKTIKIAFQFSDDAAFEKAIKISDLDSEGIGYIKGKKSIYIPAEKVTIGDKTKIKLLCASEKQKKELVDFLQIAELEDQKNSSGDTFTFSDPKAATGTTEKPVDVSSLSVIKTKVNSPLPYFQSTQEIVEELESLIAANVFEIKNSSLKKEDITNLAADLKENKAENLWENFIKSVSDKSCKKEVINNLLAYQKKNNGKKLPMLLLDALTNLLSPYKKLSNLLAATPALSTIELPESKIQPKSNPLFSSSKELAKSIDFLINDLIFDFNCPRLGFSISALKSAIQYDLNKMSIFDIQASGFHKSTTWHDVTPQDAWRIFITKFGCSGEHYQLYGKDIVERLTKLKRDKSATSHVPFIDAMIEALNKPESSPYQHLLSFYDPHLKAQKIAFLSAFKEKADSKDCVLPTIFKDPLFDKNAIKLMFSFLCESPSSHSSKDQDTTPVDPTPPKTP